MRSLYAQYLSEREGKFIVEDSYGFATYKFLPELKAVYIEDIFVVSEHRKSGVAASYADQIASEAKQKGLKYLIGSVSPKANGSTASLKVLLAYGFELDSMDANLIYFKKEL